MWEIIDTRAESAEWNMRFDAELLEGLEKTKKPIIHFYEWEKKSLTYGHFIKPEELLDLNAVKELNLDLAKRPTGGGVVFHLWDFAFSVLVPRESSFFSENTLENYAFVNDAVLNAAKAMVGDLKLTSIDGISYDEKCRHFCMAKPTKYDVVLDGKKIAGAAQRKTKAGYLHQGTISLYKPDEALLAKVLKPGTRVLEAIRDFTYPLLEDGDQRGKEKIKELLVLQLTLHSDHYVKR
jgi:lipoate---protein ligase